MNRRKADFWWDLKRVLKATCTFWFSFLFFKQESWCWLTHGHHGTSMAVEPLASGNMQTINGGYKFRHSSHEQLLPVNGSEYISGWRSLGAPHSFSSTADHFQHSLQVNYLSELRIIFSTVRCLHTQQTLLVLLSPKRQFPKHILLLSRGLYVRLPCKVYITGYIFIAALVSMMSLAALSSRV